MNIKDQVFEILYKLGVRVMQNGKSICACMPFKGHSGEIESFTPMVKLSVDKEYFMHHLCLDINTPNVTKIRLSMGINWWRNTVVRLENDDNR